MFNADLIEKSINDAEKICACIEALAQALNQSTGVIPKNILLFTDTENGNRIYFDVDIKEPISCVSLNTPKI